MKTKAEIDAIVQNVQAILNAKRKPPGLGFHVPTGGYAEHDDWLTVVVEPDDPGIHAYQYVDAISEVQDELRKTGVEKVLVAPAIGD